MKKWIVYVVCVLGLFLLSSCQSTKDEVITPPLYSQLTYSFVPDNSGAHMFDIYGLNQEGSQHEVLLKATDVGFNQPDWNADGTVMAIWGWHNPSMISIYTYNTKTEALTRLTDQNYVYDMYPHWNATGDKIVFTRQYLLENDRNEIWTMNADGSDAKKIVDGYAASWSPDGMKLVFSQVTDGNVDLYSCDKDGTNSIKLLDTPINESFPMWSPDGQQIMFNQFNSPEGVVDINSFEIGILNVQSGKTMTLTQNDYLDSGARWSPDGAKIAFLSRANGIDDFEIFVMNADGSDVKQMTNMEEGSYATFPSWRPIELTSEATQGTASAKDTVSAESTESTESLVIDPYTRSEKKLGSGRTFDFCSGDFNGDGLPDLFVTTYEGESGLYFKQGSDYALSPTHFSSPEENGHGIATGDLDLDGDLDLFLVNNSANNHVFFNDGLGNFTRSNEIYGFEDGRSLNVNLADVDGDEDLDAIVSNYTLPAQLMINDGLGRFTTTDFETFATETIEVLVDDFNNDGFIDAYFVNHNRNDQIAINDGKGGLTMMPGLYGESVSWGNAATGDINGDEYPDVVVANDEMGAGIWINDQSGKLAKFGQNIGGSNINVVLEDLDQDGDLDMVLMAIQKDVEIYLNDGLANFEFFKSLKNSRDATTALVMDFDDDGQLDILIGRMIGGNVIYYYQ